MNLLFDRLSYSLEHSLDLRLQRSNLINANISNLDTPGYTPVELNFQRELDSFMEGSDREMARGRVEYDYFSIANQDGNSVDMDHEMGKLAENQLLYRASTKAYKRRMALLRYAVMDGQG